MDQLRTDLEHLVAGRCHRRSDFCANHNSLGRESTLAMERKERFGGHPHPPSFARAGRSDFWRLATDQRQELSGRIRLRTDLDLDGIPYVSTRNRYRHIYSLGHRHLGDNAKLRPVRHGDRKSIAADLAEFNSGVDPDGDGAGCSYGGTAPNRGRARNAKSARRSGKPDEG